jgi:hypothetical protein
MTDCHRQIYVTASLTFVPISVTYSSESRPMFGRGLEAFRAARASAVPAGGLATRSRADPGLDALIVPADGRLLIFIR